TLGNGNHRAFYCVEIKHRKNNRLRIAPLHPDCQLVPANGKEALMSSKGYGKPLMRRQLLAGAALTAPVLAATAGARAAAWQPSRPVELIVGAGPGGGNDRVARMLQRIMQVRSLVPTPVVVVNRPGAGGSIAQAYLNTHAGDGHYIM